MTKQGIRTGTYVFPCPKCGKKYDLVRATNLSEKREEKQISCPNCGKSVGSRYA